MLMRADDVKSARFYIVLISYLTSRRDSDKLGKICNELGLICNVMTIIPSSQFYFRYYYFGFRQSDAVGGA